MTIDARATEPRYPAATPQPAGLPRWFNLLGAGLGLCLLAPLLVLVGILVRVDSPGPALFRQRRVGRDGKCFTCYKFRSMYVNTETPAIRIDDFETFVFSPSRARADPRQTRLGVSLRGTSVDELPQLLNVIRGEMALVGPRPELPGIVAQYPDSFRTRHQMPPGITGFAQVNGRSDLTYSETISYDLEYVRRRTAWLDLRLLWGTLGIVFHGSGAR